MNNGLLINEDMNNENQEIIIMEPEIYDKLIQNIKNKNKIDDLINDIKIKDQNKNAIPSINKKKDTIYVRGKKDGKREYFNNFKILKSSEFNSFHNYLNKKANYYSNDVVYENDKIDKIIIQIYWNQYELCQCNKDQYSCKFLFYFYEDKVQKNQENKYLKKLLYYKSFKTFLKLENYEIKEKSENIFHLIKEGKKVGKIYMIDKNYKDYLKYKEVDENLLAKNYKDKMLNKLIEMLNNKFNIIKQFDGIEFYN